MIEVTDEMVQAFEDVAMIDSAGARRGLEAVMKLIDPVPAEVRTIYTNHGDDEWRRIVAGGAKYDNSTNVYRAECGCCHFTYAEIVAEFGVVTWK